MVNTPHDIACAKRAARELGGIFIPLNEPSDATALLSGARVAITMRLHALIMATMAGVPAVGVPSDALDRKIPAFAHLAGQEFVAREELSVVTLVERTEHLLKVRERLSPLLLDAAADLQKKAKKDLENIVSMLYNNNQQHYRRLTT